MRDKQYSAQEVRRRWHNKINNRLFMDRTLAAKVQRTERSRRLLRDTWQGCVDVRMEDGGPVYTDWTKDPRVLVGIKEPPPRARRARSGNP
jgi:hypothetical protein